MKQRPFVFRRRFDGPIPVRPRFRLRNAHEAYRTLLLIGDRHIRIRAQLNQQISSY